MLVFEPPVSATAEWRGSSNGASARAHAPRLIAASMRTATPSRRLPLA